MEESIRKAERLVEATNAALARMKCSILYDVDANPEVKFERRKNEYKEHFLADDLKSLENGVKAETNEILSAMDKMLNSEEFSLARKEQNQSKSISKIQEINKKIEDKKKELQESKRLKEAEKKILREIEYLKRAEDLKQKQNKKAGDEVKPTNIHFQKDKKLTNLSESSSISQPTRPTPPSPDKPLTSRPRLTELKDKILKTQEIVNRGFQTARELKEKVECLSKTEKKTVKTSPSCDKILSADVKSVSSETIKSVKPQRKERKKLKKKNVSVLKIKRVEDDKAEDKKLRLQKLPSLHIRDSLQLQKIPNINIPSGDFHRIPVRTNIIVENYVHETEKAKCVCSEKKDENFMECASCGKLVKVYNGKMVDPHEADKLLMECNFDVFDPRIDEFVEKFSRKDSTTQKMSHDKETETDKTLEGSATETRLKISELSREITREYKEKALEIEKDHLEFEYILRDIFKKVDKSRRLFESEHFERKMDDLKNLTVTKPIIISLDTASNSSESESKNDRRRKFGKNDESWLRNRERKGISKESKSMYQNRVRNLGKFDKIPKNGFLKPDQVRKVTNEKKIHEKNGVLCQDQVRKLPNDVTVHKLVYQGEVRKPIADKKTLKDERLCQDEVRKLTGNGFVDQIELRHENTDKDESRKLQEIKNDSESIFKPTSDVLMHEIDDKAPENKINDKTFDIIKTTELLTSNLVVDNVKLNSSVSDSKSAEISKSSEDIKNDNDDYLSDFESSVESLPNEENHEAVNPLVQDSSPNLNKLVASSANDNQLVDLSINLIDFVTSPKKLVIPPANPSESVKSPSQVVNESANVFELSEFPVPSKDSVNVLSNHSVKSPELSKEAVSPKHKQLAALSKSHANSIESSKTSKRLLHSSRSFKKSVYSTSDSKSSEDHSLNRSRLPNVSKSSTSVKESAVDNFTDLIHSPNQSKVDDCIKEILDNAFEKGVSFMLKRQKNMLKLNYEKPIPYLEKSTRSSSSSEKLVEKKQKVKNSSQNETSLSSEVMTSLKEVLDVLKSQFAKTEILAERLTENVKEIKNNNESADKKNINSPVICSVQLLSDPNNINSIMINNLQKSRKDFAKKSPKHHRRRIVSKHVESSQSNSNGVSSAGEVNKKQSAVQNQVRFKRKERKGSDSSTSDSFSFRTKKKSVLRNEGIEEEYFSRLNFSDESCSEGEIHSFEFLGNKHSSSQSIGEVLSEQISGESIIEEIS